METVFERIDAKTKNYLGFFNPFAFLWNIKIWRIYFGLCICGSLFFWTLFGWDSTWSQLLPFIENLKPLVFGKVSLWEIWEESQIYYGIGNHWSAPVIYGSAFLILSYYLEIRHGIVKSYNWFIATSLSLMNIGIFELMWNSLYAHYQEQIWTITWAWKQSNNLFFFFSFSTIGILMLLYVCTGGYKPNIGRNTRILTLVAIFMWIFWVNYPFEVEYINVETATGIWTNTNKFPQTYYAVDIIPNDGRAIGEPFHVNNDFLHLINNLVKIFTTGAILSFCCVINKGNS